MARTLSDTQQRVIDCLTVFGECNKKKLYDQCAGYYHQNGMFHFGNILANMVTKGMIIRVQKGVYALKQKQILPNNIGLFENIE